MAKKKTMFGEAKYKKYAEIISLKDPESAKKSIKKLKEEFESAKTPTKALRVKRVTILASNRAYAISRRKGLSNKEKKEFNVIGKLYAKAFLGFKIKK